MRAQVPRTAAAMLLFAGCASDPGDTGDKFEEAPQVAEALGCTGSDMEIATDVAPSMFAAETVRCDAHGEVGFVVVDYFADIEARDKALELGTNRGLMYVVGDPWTVNADTESQLDAAMNAVGGEPTYTDLGEVVP